MIPPSADILIAVPDAKALFAAAFRPPPYFRPERTHSARRENFPLMIKITAPSRAASSSRIERGIFFKPFPDEMAQKAGFFAPIGLESYIKAT